MSEKFIELIIEVRPGRGAERLLKRLRAKGLNPSPMKVGLLLAGTVSVLRKAIPSLTGDEVDGLAVPDDWGDEVQAIHVVKPRSLL